MRLRRTQCSFRQILACSFLIACGFGLFFTSQSHSLASNAAYVITLDDDTINPVTAEYITKSIDKSEQEGARLLIIQLDTPGGLLSSTRTIVKRMLTARIPIVVYIAPSGSRAGSAGVFITYASHIAAMAPSTNIGAAHPVQMGGDAPNRRGTDWGELKELLEEIRDRQMATDKAPEGAEQEDGPATGVEPKTDHTEDVAPGESEESAVESAGMSSAAGDKADDAIAPDENPMGSKLLNDTLAFIKTIAQERGRNVEWAIDSVAKSDSITSDEALAKDVVEFVAQDIPDLLRQLDGHEFRLNGEPVTLKTTQLTVIEIPMDARQSFLNILANPNIAYFLMILGFYGLLFEITHPGIGAPGIIGAIFLILAFYSLQTLPTNYAGVALVILGLILFISEAYTPTFGLLTLGGAVCLVLGSVLLFDSADPVMQVSKTLIGVLAISTSAISLFLLTYMLKGQRKAPKGGLHRLLGQKGEVQRPVKAGEEGKVFVSGEIWNATSEEDLSVGDKVIIDSVEEGMVVKVRKIT